ncbi:murein biosynthesis integral membrane protein MurJ [Bacillus massilinigeriensis]|uniref:murein biosynthesis integral membrane protein MurJ n=1 Tax=Bacillus mediterraneensis TaxID=1805474 RepID=UPI0008F95E8F|nr:murein biosynthesis integral membrane protein MurJ [Bacillus mediterraneensis]
MRAKFNKLPGIVKAVGIVTVISAFGKVLGFVREAIIATYFGASEMADVFFVANMIPTLLYTAIGIAIYSGIIPIYVEEKERDPLKADETMSVLGTVFLVIATFISVLSFILSEELVRIFAPGFSDSQQQQAALLTKIMVPGIIFMALTTISTGVLNSHKKFVTPSLTATAQNIVVILFTVLLADEYGVKGLAAGVLVGTIFQFIIQYPSISKYNIRLNFSFKKERKRIKETLILFYPIIVASLAVQINGVTDRVISSGLDEGSVSALSYANKLMQLPLSIVMAPLITVLYPSIVESAIKGKEEFFRLVMKGAKTIIYLSIPFVAVMVVGGKDLIQLAFQRGAFDIDATMKTVPVFIFYSLGLVFFALRDYLMNCLYALKETKLAMYTSISMVLVYIVLSFTLSTYFEVSGIAIATSFATFLQASMLAFFLWIKTKPGRGAWNELVWDILKFLAAFAGSSIAAYPVYQSLNELPAIPLLTVITIVVFAVFLVLSYILRIQETKAILKLFKKG